MPQKIATVYVTKGNQTHEAHVTHCACPLAHGTRIFKADAIIRFLIGKSVPESKDLVQARGMRWRVRYES